jgi:hypothetical protein
MGLVAHLSRYDINIVQRGHLLQQLRPCSLVQANSYTRHRGVDEVTIGWVDAQLRQQPIQYLQVQVRPTAALQPRGVLLHGVHPDRASTMLERGDALRQEIEHHHHRRQALLCQELNPPHHGAVG